MCPANQDVLEVAVQQQSGQETNMAGSQKAEPSLATLFAPLRKAKTDSGHWEKECIDEQLYERLEKMTRESQEETDQVVMA